MPSSETLALLNFTHSPNYAPAPIIVGDTKKKIMYDTALMDVMKLLGEPLFDPEIMVDEVDRVYLAIKKASSYEIGMIRIRRVIDYLNDSKKEIPKKYTDLVEYYKEQIKAEENAKVDLREISRIVQVEQDWYDIHDNHHMSWQDLQIKLIFYLLVNFIYDEKLLEVQIADYHTSGNYIDTSYIKIETRHTDGLYIGQHRYMNLSSEAGMMIEDMLEKRDNQFSDMNYLLSSKEGVKLSYRGFQKMVERAFKEQKFRHILEWNKDKFGERLGYSIINKQEGINDKLITNEEYIYKHRHSLYSRGLIN